MDLRKKWDTPIKQALIEANSFGFPGRKFGNPYWDYIQNTFTNECMWHPNERVRRVYGEFLSETQRQRETEYQTKVETGRKVFDEAIKEIGDAYHKSQAKTQAAQGKVQSITLETSSQPGWCDEIYKASGKKPQTIESCQAVPEHKTSPQEIEAQAWKEIEFEAKRLFSPLSIDPETENMAKEFLAQIYGNKGFFVASIDKFEALSENEKILKISGTVLQFDYTNKNNWIVSSKDKEQITESLKGVNILCDHDTSVRSIVGKVTDSFVEGDKLKFAGLIDCDPLVQKLIKKGRVRFVSVGLQGEPYCSKCEKPARPKVCECKASLVIRRPSVRELSIVLDPAYEGISSIETISEEDE